MVRSFATEFLLTDPSFKRLLAFTITDFIRGIA